MNFQEKLLNYIDASYAAMYITTHEELRICKEIYGAFKETKQIYEWDSLTGLSTRTAKDKTKSIAETDDPIKLLTKIHTICLDGSSDINLFILKDFHLQFENPLKKINLIRAVKNVIEPLKARGSMIIFLAPVTKIPTELTKEIQSLDYALPNEESLNGLLTYVIGSANTAKSPKDKITVPAALKEKVIDSAKGMTASEAENALSLAIVENKQVNDAFIKSVFQEKVQQVKKSGLLHYLDSTESFENVGGLSGVKEWINTRKTGFSKKARDYGLPFPKGIGLAGIAGCGKTLISKAIAKELGFPLFQLNLGSMFNKFVGETEQNYREMIKIIESIGHCVIQIDEVEKYLNNGAVSGQGDSGTSSRSFGTLLTWLNDRNSPAFIICTSNNHLILPVELVRKGRFDEWFWVDLPNQQERENIFKVVISKYARKPENFRVSTLANESEQFTGAEIENAFKDAMFKAFHQEQEVTGEHVLDELEKVIPQAVINKDSIQAMRAQVEGRMRLASGEEKAKFIDVTTPRRIRA